MSKTALITGASSGIGASFARQLAAEGYHVILVARRAEKLEALAAEVSATGSIRAEVIPADLSRPEAPAEILKAVTERGLQVDLLINNAGIGAHGAFETATHEDDQRMIDLNIIAGIDVIGVGCERDIFERRQAHRPEGARR